MAVFEKFKQAWGNAIESEKVPDDIIQYYQGKLPDELIELWKEDGWGGYLDGILWTINPKKYEEYLKKWIIINYKAYPFMRTAYGDLLILYKDIKNIINVDIIDVRHQTLGMITPNGLEDFFENKAIRKGKITGKINGLSLLDVSESLGNLHHDECYGFQPILALGGEEKIENLKIVKFDTHLEILTQALSEPIEA